jgi:hypothetical protein
MNQVSKKLLEDLIVYNFFRYESTLLQNSQYFVY